MRVASEPPALLERADLPLPAGEVSGRSVPAVVVGTPDAHPADLVEVVLRRSGRAARVIRALRLGTGSGDPVRWFRAQLTALEPDGDEYRVEWSRAGRRIATLPADGSWIPLFGVAGPDASTPRTPGTAMGAWSSAPRYGYHLEFFAALTVNLRAEVLGATPEGYRINFYVVDGRVIGPGIDAVVEPDGGDWMCIRPDGIGAVNIKITYRMRDGARVLEEAGGVFDLGPNGYGDVAAGRLHGTPPFYATPRWSTSHPDWMWLNRRQGIGVGRVVLETLQVQCDIYLPLVEGRIDGG